MASRNRGKPKPRLGDLSREHPTKEEAQAVDEAFLHGPPLVTAILGASEVELRLEQALRRKLQISDDGIWKELTGLTGPLASFNQKILMGEALKIYTADVAANINIIRSIRNVFAHAKKLIDFDNPLIIDELKSVRLPAKSRSKDYKTLSEIKNARPGNGKHYFCILVYRIDIFFFKREARISKNKTNRIVKNYKNLLTSDGYYGNWLISPHLIKNGLPAPRSILSDGFYGDDSTSANDALGPLPSDDSHGL